MGLSPAEFWTLTPWQLRCSLEGYRMRREADHDQAAWMMWHGAVLQRVKKIPALDEFLAGKKKRVNTIDEAAILTRLKAYNKRVTRGSGS